MKKTVQNILRRGVLQKIRFQTICVWVFFGRMSLNNLRICEGFRPFIFSKPVGVKAERSHIPSLKARTRCTSVRTSGRCHLSENSGEQVLIVRLYVFGKNIIFEKKAMTTLQIDTRSSEAKLLLEYLKKQRFIKVLDDHVPNAETKRAIEDAENGKVIHATSVSDLMSKLRS